MSTRAGQHRKGFAVVAEEVRNLASRSAEAAKETAALIEPSNTQILGGYVNGKKQSRNLKIANRTPTGCNTYNRRGQPAEYPRCTPHVFVAKLSR